VPQVALSHATVRLLPPASSCGCRCRSPTSCPPVCWRRDGSRRRGQRHAQRRRSRCPSRVPPGRQKRCRG